jgi:hypothetical protein
MARDCSEARTVGVHLRIWRNTGLPSFWRCWPWLPIRSIPATRVRRRTESVETTKGAHERRDTHGDARCSLGHRRVRRVWVVLPVPTVWRPHVHTAVGCSGGDSSIAAAYSGGTADLGKRASNDVSTTTPSLESRSRFRRQQNVVAGPQRLGLSLRSRSPLKRWPDGSV